MLFPDLLQNIICGTHRNSQHERQLTLESKMKDTHIWRDWLAHGNWGWNRAWGTPGSRVSSPTTWWVKFLQVLSVEGRFCWSRRRGEITKQQQQQMTMKCMQTFSHNKACFPGNSFSRADFSRWVREQEWIWLTPPHLHLLCPQSQGKMKQPYMRKTLWPWPEQISDEVIGSLPSLHDLP